MQDDASNEEIIITINLWQFTITENSSCQRFPSTGPASLAELFAVVSNKGTAAA